MKTSTTFSVLFWLKQSKAKNGEAPLYARITVNGQRAEISLKRKINITNWNATKNRVKGTNQEARTINEYLNQVQKGIIQSKNELSLENKFITSQAIKSRYLKEDEQNHTINDIIKYHNDDMVNKLKWGTQKNYYTTQKYISKFVKKQFNTSDMYLKQLDYNFILKFEKFLREYQPLDHQKKMGNNSVMKHIERFRKMITLSYKLEWIKRDPFINFNSKFEKVERGYLTEIELETIEEKQFSIPRLQLVKDLFIFSCYTGLSYIDVMNLIQDNINFGIDGELWIIKKREKTNKLLRIPILPKAKKLIDKYKANPKSEINGTIFPKISNQKLNSYLKEVADVCSIKKNLTFHLARHTFATTVTLTNGVPIETVSQLLGHSRISTTQIYAKVIERKVSEDMAFLKKHLSMKVNTTKKIKIM
ncbi:site-specific integrase [Polaribacter atrinae]|uniref:site-specific integrase n=1 Tax=Polaribacter atrinae TaxID=1333662 RepID=UPI0024907674|nr:site-specific integrase [Polaribacter atrinae]